MLRRRRAGLAVSAAIGAAVLAGPAAAQAANFTVDTNADSGAGSLRQAISDANGNSEDDTITFDSSLSGQTIRLTSGQLAIDASNHALTIQGPSAHDVTISGDADDSGTPTSGDSRIFSVSGSHAVDISGLTLTGGYADNSDGGALFTDTKTDVTVSNSVFTGNNAKGGSSGGGGIGGGGDSDGGNGGAIGALGSLDVSDSQFQTNHADQAGGAIFTRNGMTMRTSTLTGNTANTRGGAIAGAKYDCSYSTCSPVPTVFFHSDLDIAGTSLVGNTAGYSGGAIDAPALLALSGSTVRGNTADGIGGGIDSFGKYAQTQISDTTISGNTSHGSGGGISVVQLAGANPVEFKYSGNAEPLKHAVKSDITRTTIAGNRADYSGGGVGVLALGDGDHFTISHSTVSGNSAASEGETGFGGGIYFGSYIPTARTDRASNSSGYGGPIDGEFSTSDTTISGNNADVGGGVSLGGRSQAPPLPPALLAKVPLAAAATGRSPSNEDSPIVGVDGSIDFQNSTIASNSASQFGGGVYLNQYADDPGAESPNLVSPTIQLTSSILADNSAKGAANDAERPDGSTAGGIDSAFSLVENPLNVPFVASQSSLTGIDPQLGALGDNGGPTQTQLPSTTSPVIDRGKAPARLLDDQRSLARIVDGSAANAAGGDGADIGAVEVQNPAQNVVVPTPAQQVVNISDNTPPRIRLRVPRSLSIAQLIRGFNVGVNCNEPCSMTFRLYASAPTGTLHSAGYNFRLLNKKIGRKSGSRKVHLQPCLAGSPSKRRTHVCRKRITAALFAKPQKRFKVKLIVAAKDKAGNVSHRKAFIRIHR